MANTIKSLAKTGFGLGIGIYGAQILFLLLGMAIFLPGYSMYQKAKQEGSSNTMLPLGLMFVGVIIMGGIGFGVLLDSMGDF